MLLSRPRIRVHPCQRSSVWRSPVACLLLWHGRFKLDELQAQGLWHSPWRRL